MFDKPEDARNRDWTTDRIELLETLWARGDSAGRIAAQLGGITRSAVLGKVHRLKLPSRITLSDFQKQRYRSGPVSYEEKQRREAERLAHRLIAQQRRRQSNKSTVSLPPRPAAPPIHAPRMRPCSLFELTRETCRWPIGHPGTSDFFFCGAKPQNHKPYCPHHERIAHARLPGVNGRPFVQNGWAA